MLDWIKDYFQSNKYDKEKNLASSDKSNDRMRLAADKNARPEILYFLASDQDTEVKRTVAQNKATPIQAMKLLSKDEDENVRLALAGKIDHILPNIDEEQKTKFSKIAHETLSNLARDRVQCVRETLAEVLKDKTNVPHDVIKTLALDESIPVSEKVLQYSPVLTEEDILEVIAADPEGKKLVAIAKRNKLQENICDKVARSDQDEAISELLKNKSAQIREDTLDHILETAPEIVAWHQPLTKRPVLHFQAIQKLADFVAENLLFELAKREDIEESSMNYLAGVVRARVSQKTKENDGATSIKKSEEKAEGQAKQINRPKKESKPKSPLLKKLDDLLETSPYSWAFEVHKHGLLDEDILFEKIESQHNEAIAAGLEYLSDVPCSEILNAAQEKNLKFLVSVCWKSKLSMRFAIELQKALTGTKMSDVIKSSDLVTYPLDEAEMEKILKA